MPRGVPNAKKDEFGLRYTSFHVPLAQNPKHMGTSYLKSDSQTLWARNAARRQKAAEVDPAAQVSDQRRGSQTIVIHPGSKLMRIGKASDVTPVSIPTVVARKQKPPVHPPEFREGVSRPRKRASPPTPPTSSPVGDEYAVQLESDDPFDAKLASITVSLRERMRFYKLRVTPNAASIASSFNDQFKPETIPEANDPFRVEWIQKPINEDVLVGEAALRLGDPQVLDYVVRWPTYGPNFNTRDYPSIQMIANDIGTIIEHTLREKFSISKSQCKDYSVILVIPDFYDRDYVREYVNILMLDLGFKQLCVLQESLAATYGAGISNACVVDIGATCTSVACVDEGLVIADSRMSLNMGGDDVTEFLYVLLDRISFPYREINLARSYDWGVMEDLKARLCTLAEGDVALNLYDFVVRRPGKPTEKFGLRAYDEVILAPMCIFEPRVIEFDRKRVGFRPVSHADVTEEIIENPSDHVTQAMIISTQHLLPSPVTVLEAQNGLSRDTVPKQEQQDVPLSSTATSIGDAPAQSTSTDSTAEGTADAPMEIVDIEGEDKSTVPPPAPSQSAPPQLPPPTINPSGFAIDVCFEASKLPLDVAIFNSARASGGDEKIRKYLQAVLVIGGSAMIPGMAHALESRLQAIATPLVPNMEKVQIIPPPKGVDPRVLAWKGAAVLAKMESAVADLWITPADWDILGMRGLKERCYYL